MEIYYIYLQNKSFTYIETAMIRKKRGTLQPENSSLVINLHPMLQARGIEQPFSFLSKLGINATSVNKLLQGKAVQINLRQITAICLGLNCTPNDIFMLRKMQLPPLHQLHKLQDSELEIIKPKNLYDHLSLDEIRQLSNEQNV